MHAHEFHTSGDYVAEAVEVNGEMQGLRAFIEGLETVVHAFPDYQWHLRHLFVDGCWIHAHFLNTGTHRGAFLGVPATGRSASTQEFRRVPRQRRQDRRGVGRRRQPAPARPTPR